MLCKREPSRLSPAIKQAILLGDLETLDRLFRSISISIHDRDQEGYTALHFAAREGKFEVVDYLIKTQGADIQARTISGCTPLHFACSQGHLNIVKYLCLHPKADQDYLQAKALINGTAFTAFCLAVQNDHKEIAWYFYAQHRAAIQKDETAFLFATSKNYLEILNAFALDENDKAKMLKMAAGFGYLDIVKYLCEYLNTDIEASYAHDFTNTKALHVASREGHLDVVKYLCECYQASYRKTKMDDGNTVNDGVLSLHAAIQSGHQPIIRYLCEEKKCSVDINQKINGNDALHYAILKKRVEPIKYLLRHPNTRFDTIMSNLERIKTSQVFNDIKSEVQAKISSIKDPNDALFPLALYFKQWKANHCYCRLWKDIDPSRFIFAYKILHASKKDRDTLIHTILRNHCVSSLSSHSFATALSHIYSPSVDSVTKKQDFDEHKITITRTHR